MKQITKQLIYRVWYKKTLKHTGKPLMVQNVLTGKLINTNHFNMNSCEIRMSFNNSIGESKSCGATTVLEVWV